jgi:hypothetical protein
MESVDDLIKKASFRAFIGFDFLLIYSGSSPEMN